MMRPTDRTILTAATNTAGELSHRKAQDIRRMGYRVPGDSGDYAPYFLGDCLAADRYGNNALNDRWTANDRDAHTAAKQRAQTRIEWRTQLINALKRLSTNDAEWRDFIDQLADSGKVHVFALGINAEMRAA